MKFYQGPRGGIREDDYCELMRAAAGSGRVLEFGPGGSTFAFIEAGAQYIATCEHTPLWRERAMRRFRDHPAVVVYEYVNAPGVSVGGLAHEAFDLAFVDSPAGEGRALIEQTDQEGMNRLNTVLYALERAPIVMLHDARREREQRTLEFLRARGHAVEMIETVKGIARITA